MTTYAKLPTEPNADPRFFPPVAGIRCGLGHGGDDTLTQDGAWCQCNGCREMYSTEEVWRTIGFKGQNGCGSLYDSRV